MQSGHRTFLPLAAALLLALASPAAAADAERGARIAKEQCSACHAVAPLPPGEVAVAPPFAVIARTYDFDAGKIAGAILGPHPRMNFVPAPADAADIAAWLAERPR